MRKICFQIHKWLSIPFGIILAIVCLTGAILALEPELSELFYRSRYYVKEVQATPLPTEQLLEAAREQLPPSLEATGIQESDDPQRTYQVTLKGKRKAAFIDPYTAKVVAIDDGTGFFMKTMRFHRWLYDTYKRGAFSWGKTIVGYSTLAMVIILITGLILWFPKKGQSWRNRFVIHTRNGWLRFWHDLHVVGGFYVSLFLLCMSLTGLSWSFGWTRKLMSLLFDHRLLYSLHTGVWGGFPARLFYALVALMGVVLVCTGYYLWLSPSKRKRKAH